MSNDAAENDRGRKRAEVFTAAVADDQDVVKRRRPFCADSVYREMQKLESIVVGAWWALRPIAGLAAPPEDAPPYAGGLRESDVAEQVDRLCDAIRVRLDVPVASIELSPTTLTRAAPPPPRRAWLYVRPAARLRHPPDARRGGAR